MSIPIKLSFKDKYEILQKEFQTLKEQLNLLKQQAGAMLNSPADIFTVFNGTVLPVRVYNVQGLLIIANPANQRILGFGLKENLQKYHILEDVSPRNGDLRQAFLRCRQERSIVTTSPQPHRANYQECNLKITEEFRQLPIWVEHTYFPIFSQKGELQLIGEFIIDITNRHHAYLEQKNYDEACRFLVENSSQGQVIVQKNSDTGRTHVVYANKIAAKNMGIPLREVVGSSSIRMLQFVHPEDVPSVIKTMRSLQDGSQRHVHHRMRVIKPNMEIRVLEINSSLIAKYRGRPAIQITSLDVTDRES